METHSFVGKHECCFVHEEGQLSYDPVVYSSSYQDRFHIKTIDVRRTSPLAFCACLPAKTSPGTPHLVCHHFLDLVGNL